MMENLPLFQDKQILDAKRLNQLSKFADATACRTRLMVGMGLVPGGEPLPETWNQAETRDDCVRFGHLCFVTEGGHWIELSQVEVQRVDGVAKLLAQFGETVSADQKELVRDLKFIWSDGATGILIGHIEPTSLGDHFVLDLPAITVASTSTLYRASQLLRERIPEIENQLVRHARRQPIERSRLLDVLAVFRTLPRTPHANLWSSALCRLSETLAGFIERLAISNRDGLGEIEPAVYERLCQLGAIERNDDALTLKLRQLYDKCATSKESAGLLEAATQILADEIAPDSDLCRRLNPDAAIACEPSFPRQDAVGRRRYAWDLSRSNAKHIRVSSSNVLTSALPLYWFEKDGGVARSAPQSVLAEPRTFRIDFKADRLFVTVNDDALIELYLEPK